MNVYVASARLRSFHHLYMNLLNFELFYSDMNYFIHLWIILFTFELFYSLWITFELFYSGLFVCLSCGLMSAPLLNLLAHSGTSGLFACLFKLWVGVSSLTESPCSLSLSKKFRISIFWGLWEKTESIFELPENLNQKTKSIIDLLTKFSDLSFLRPVGKNGVLFWARGKP